MGLAFFTLHGFRAWTKGTKHFYPPSCLTCWSMLFLLLKIFHLVFLYLPLTSSFFCDNIPSWSSDWLWTHDPPALVLWGLGWFCCQAMHAPYVLSAVLCLWKLQQTETSSILSTHLSSPNSEQFLVIKEKWCIFLYSIPFLSTDNSRCMICGQYDYAFWE